MPAPRKAVKTIKSPPPKRTTGVIVLPSRNDLSVPPEDFLEYTTLIYGKKGIGKTTATSTFPDYLNCCFEPGRKNIEIRKIDFDLKTAQELMECSQSGDYDSPEEYDPWLKLMEVGRLSIDDDTVAGLAIDTVDMAYSACQESVCARAGVESCFAKVQGQNLWDTLRMEFTGFFHLLRSKGVGTLFISHAKEREAELMEGVEGVTMVGPSCPPACAKIMKQICDYWFFYGYSEGKRCLWLDDPEMNVEVACGRGFKAKDGTQLEKLILPNDPSKFYSLVDKAYGSKSPSPSKPKTVKKAVKKAAKKAVKRKAR